MSATVYFSPVITPEKVLDMFKLVDKTLPGNIAIKLHSGEKGNQNFLGPEFWKPVIDYVGGTVVECNTAYDGARNTTEKHRKLMDEHGWSRYFTVDLLDAEGPDMQLDIPSGKVIKKNFVGKDLKNYDSMLVLSHFKGHPMGGYGGALKQLSIGVASSYGKAYIHGAGVPEDIWTAEHDSFLESMADAAGSVVNYFHGNMIFINVMKNMSVDCDCCEVAEDPAWRTWAFWFPQTPLPSTRRALIWCMPALTPARRISLSAWKAGTAYTPLKPPQRLATAAGNTRWCGLTDFVPTNMID